MRKIALLGIVLVTFTILGCSKKSDESASKSQMSPVPSAQESAPAPMQNMDSSSSEPNDTGNDDTMQNDDDEEEQSHDENVPISTD